MIWWIILYLSIGVLIALINYETIERNIKKHAFDFGEQILIGILGMTKAQKRVFRIIMSVNIVVVTFFYPIVFFLLWLRKKGDS